MIFRFKDYAEAGKSAINKRGLFSFITYLTQHIPDKYFQVVRPYGLFSNRLKGQLFAKANLLLNHAKDTKESAIHIWRQRQVEHTGKDPLVCEQRYYPIIETFPNTKGCLFLIKNIQDLLPL